MVTTYKNTVEYLVVRAQTGVTSVDKSQFTEEKQSPLRSMCCEPSTDFLMVLPGDSVRTGVVRYSFEAWVQLMLECSGSKGFDRLSASVDRSGQFLPTRWRKL